MHLNFTPQQRPPRASDHTERGPEKKVAPQLGLQGEAQKQQHRLQIWISFFTSHFVPSLHVFGLDGICVKSNLSRPDGRLAPRTWGMQPCLRLGILHLLSATTL